MKHRILVLGAGYAGAYAAGNLARRLSPADPALGVDGGHARQAQPHPGAREDVGELAGLE
ncbi:hypothetical protein ACQP1W_45945 [Spirillospora sp. CA-255316]